MIKVYRVPRIDVNKIIPDMKWGENTAYNQGYWYFSSLPEAKKTAQNEIYSIPHEEAVQDSKRHILKNVLDKLTEEEVELLKDEFVKEYKVKLSDFTVSYCSYCNNTGIIGDHLGAVTCQCRALTK